MRAGNGQAYLGNAKNYDRVYYGSKVVVTVSLPTTVRSYLFSLPYHGFA